MAVPHLPCPPLPGTPRAGLGMRGWRGGRGSSVRGLGLGGTGRSWGARDGACGAPGGRWGGGGRRRLPQRGREPGRRGGGSPWTLWPKASRSKRTGRRAAVAVIAGRPGSRSRERRGRGSGSGRRAGLLVADAEGGAGARRGESQGCTGLRAALSAAAAAELPPPPRAPPFSYRRPPAAPAPRPRLRAHGAGAGQSR